MLPTAGALRRLGVGLALPLLVVSPALAQSPTSDDTAVIRPDVTQSEITRARILARLGRVEEARAAFRAILTRSGDPELRADYADLLLDLSLVEEARAEIDALARAKPDWPRARRLRARAAMLRGDASEAAADLESLSRELPGDVALRADLAEALSRDGRWRRAVSLYADLLEGDDGPDGLRAAYRELVLAHARRLEIAHLTLFQVAATHHVEEVAWRGWLAEKVWLRVGARHGIYTQDALPGQDGFTREIETAFALVGIRPTARLELRLGLDQSVLQPDVSRTTGRAGATWDDGRATSLGVDLALREPLTNPVTAIPGRGATDRLLVTASRRLVDRVTLAGHYRYDLYRFSGETLGAAWEADVRTELELLRGRVQVTLVPQVFLREYTPRAGSPARDIVSFIRREDVLATALVIAVEPVPGLRMAVTGVGRRDMHRSLTSWEVNGEIRWRFHPRAGIELLYTRNTEGGTIGGKEESVRGALFFLH